VNRHCSVRDDQLLNVKKVVVGCEGRLVVEGGISRCPDLYDIVTRKKWNKREQ